MSDFFPIHKYGNSQFLGLLIDDDSYDNLENINDISVFVSCLFYVNFKNIKKELINNYGDRIVRIKIRGNSLNFNMDLTEKKIYHDLGYQSAKQYFDNVKTEDTHEDTHDN